MTEIRVQQRTPEWIKLRQSVSVTASNFGETLGIGRGLPYHYLESLLENNTQVLSGNQLSNIQHGIKMEPVIDEAYQLLNGYQTTQTGFWIPSCDDPLYGKIGASPDAKVIDPSTEMCIGLTEYKAPVYQMYNDHKHPHGIPRHYMAQIQGQLAISRLPWCDFMAICARTHEIMLKRVYYCKQYWAYVSRQLELFCTALQQAKQNMNTNTYVVYPELAVLQKQQMNVHLLPGEDDIIVENLLQSCADSKIYMAKRHIWMTYEFLVGIA